MANFQEAFDIMIKNEGGYTLTNIKGDKGGQTYAGISRNNFPNWIGWNMIDENISDSLSDKVKEFYKTEFWDKIKGEDIKLQKIANTIFDFAINVGVAPSIKKTQIVMSMVNIDGVMGKQTLQQLNMLDSKWFCSVFALEKIKHYSAICTKNPSQVKFLLGWINRSIKTV